MREILRSLRKRKFSNLMIVIQIVISLMFFFQSYAQYQSVARVFQGVPKELKEDTSQIIMLEVNNEMEPEEFQNYLAQLRKSGLIKNFSGYKNSWVESDMFGSETLDALHLENNMDWMRELHTLQGRGFQASDYDHTKYNGSKDKPYPAMLGSELAQKTKVKIGDTISDLNSEYYHIVGILDKGETWFSQTIPEGRMTSLDNQLVVAKSDHSKMFFHYYCQPTSGENTEHLLEQLNQVAEESGVIVRAQLVRDILQTNYESDLHENIIWLVCSILVLFFISIATGTLMAARLYARKKEIGIRKAVGYSSVRLGVLFVGEFLIIGLIACSIACLLEQYMIGGGVTEYDGTEYITQYYFNGKMVTWGILLTIAQLVPSCVIALYKLGRMQPKNLIGGKE